MKILKILLLALLLSSCHQNQSSLEKGPVVAVENITPTKDQAERRRLSEDYCKSHNVPIYKNPNALFTDPEDSVSIRTKEEVEDRALALCYLGLKSEGLDKKKLDEIDKNYHISFKLTSEEKDYVNAVLPTEQQKIDANWRYEDLHVMLWALGFIDELSYPDKVCNVATDVKIIHDLTEDEFREKAKLRSKKEILDQADLILRLHWACVSARLKKQPASGTLNVDVVVERHHSLNWLINYMNQAWDDVTTDT